MDEVRQTELVDRVAERVRRWGLSGLASALLDSLHPLAFVAGQLLWVAQPALDLVVGTDQVAEVARLLEQPETLSLLRARLEEV